VKRNKCNSIIFIKIFRLLSLKNQLYPQECYDVTYLFFLFQLLRKSINRAEFVVEPIHLTPHSLAL